MIEYPTGGTLKTLEDKDEESLQGKWCPLDDVKRENPDLPLRATDILALLDTTIKYKQEDPKPHPVLPVLNPHNKLLLRSVFISHDGYVCTVKYVKLPFFKIFCGTSVLFLVPLIAPILNFS